MLIGGSASNTQRRIQWATGPAKFAKARLFSYLFTSSSITRGEAEEDTDATKMDEDENCMLSLAIVWCFLTPEVGVGNIAAGAVVWFRLPGE